MQRQNQINFDGGAKTYKVCRMARQRYRPYRFGKDSEQFPKQKTKPNFILIGGAKTY